MIREAFRNHLCKYVSLQIEAKSDENVCQAQQELGYFLYWSDMELNAFNHCSRKSSQHTSYLHSFHFLLANFVLFSLKELITASVTLLFALAKEKILFGYSERVSRKVRTFTTSCMVYVISHTDCSPGILTWYHCSVCQNQTSLIL